MSKKDEYAAPANKTTNYKAIRCEQIPDLLLNKLEAEKYFNKFGKIKRLSYDCTVEYENEQDGRTAFLEAGNFNDTTFLVNYAAHDVHQVPKVEERVTSEVQAECQSMNSSLNRFDLISTNKIAALDVATTLNKSLTKSNKSGDVMTLKDELSKICINIKETNIEKAVTIRCINPSICHDMKRLMQDFQWLASLIEGTAETEDSEIITYHQKAIKEYSPNNVGHEFTVAHKIWFDSVLLPLMFYLMHHVMNGYEVPQPFLSDWFSFFGNRKQSTGEDITRSLVAMKPPEQCSRFHIQCGAKQDDLQSVLQKTNFARLPVRNQNQNYASFDAYRISKFIALTTENQLKDNLIENKMILQSNDQDIFLNPLKKLTLPFSNDNNLFKIPVSAAPKSLKWHRKYRQETFLTRRSVTDNNTGPVFGFKLENRSSFRDYPRHYSRGSNKFFSRSYSEKSITTNKNIFNRSVPTKTVFNSMIMDRKELDKLDSFFIQSSPSFEKLENRKNEKVKENELECKREQGEEQNYEKTVTNEAIKEMKQMASEAVQKHIETTVQDWNWFFEQLLTELIEELIYKELAVLHYKKLLLNKYFYRWLKFWRTRKQTTQLLDKTSLLMSTDSQAQVTKKIAYSCQEQNVATTNPYHLGISCECSSPHERLDLFAFISQHLFTQLHYQRRRGVLSSITYFKILISLPADQEELPGFEEFCNNWLMEHIEGTQMGTSGPFLHDFQHNLALCIRKLIGIEALNEQGNRSKEETDHNDGIICFVSGVNMETSSRKRLDHLLLISKNYKRIPLAIIAYNCENYDRSTLEQCLGLQRFAEVGFIENYKCFGFQLTRREFNFAHLFKEAINFVTFEAYRSNTSDLKALASQPLSRFLCNCLGDEMWSRWLESSKRNPMFHKVCSSPEYVVGIFNKAIGHLEHIIQENFDEMPEFPYELKMFVPEPPDNYETPLGLEYFPADWKDPERQIFIKQILESIRLPLIRESFPEQISRDVLESWLLHYIYDCVPEEDYCFITEITGLAHEELVKQFSFLNIQKIDFVNPKLLNYVQIIKFIAYGRINSVVKKHTEEQLALPVIYLCSDLDSYRTFPWWLNCEAIREVTRDYLTTAPIEIIPIINTELPSTSVNKATSSSETAGILPLILEEYSQASNQQSPVLPPLDNVHHIESRLNETFYRHPNELTLNIIESGASCMKKVIEDLDIEEGSTPKADIPSKGKKRKRFEHPIDMKAVVATAMDLIKQYDALEESRERSRSTLSLNDSFFPFND
uniref:Uncharacterized protein n=1 Tax=Glossina brevipalpis TaxID=37001 RepID=A0A1A9WL84_9MUSC